MYRNDEEAALRRRLAELSSELEAAKGELETQQNARRRAEAQLKHAEDSERAIRERLREYERRGTSRERLHAAITTGSSWALSTSGLAAAAMVIVFALAALFSSCRGCSMARGVAPDVTGVVTDRYHYHERHYTTCSGSGSRRHCTHHTIPEHWTIRVAHDGGEREIALDEETWNETRIGQPWCDQPPCAPLPTTEER